MSRLPNAHLTHRIAQQPPASRRHHHPCVTQSSSSSSQTRRYSHRAPLQRPSGRMQSLGYFLPRDPYLLSAYHCVVGWADCALMECTHVSSFVSSHIIRTEPNRYHTGPRYLQLPPFHSWEEALFGLFYWLIMFSRGQKR